MTVDPARRKTTHKARLDKKVAAAETKYQFNDLIIIMPASDKFDARAKEMILMTALWPELYAANENRIRAISPANIKDDKYAKAFATFAEIAWNKAEDELLCLLEETIPPGMQY